jgi:AcrR family transcriptional regulator
VVDRQDRPDTRRRLLEIGQQHIYLHGFQGASVDNILRGVGVTKGAFFHYFASKAEFGYSVVEEVLAEMIAAQWVTPLLNSSDALETVAVEFEKGTDVLKLQQPILGCPLNNLAQEMNPLDDGFRSRTLAVFQMWRDSFRDALARAQQDGIVRVSIDASDEAYALVAQIEGILSMARSSQDPDTLMIGARVLRRYLDSMRSS